MCTHCRLSTDSISTAAIGSRMGVSFGVASPAGAGLPAANQSFAAKIPGDMIIFIYFVRVFCAYVYMYTNYMYAYTCTCVFVRFSIPIHHFPATAPLMYTCICMYTCVHVCVCVYNIRTLCPQQCTLNR